MALYRRYDNERDYRDDRDRDRGWIPPPHRELERRASTLRVAGSSDPKTMSTAIERRLAEQRAVKLEAVGANSVNQASKAIAIARSNLENAGKSLAVYVEFIHIAAKEEGESDRSAIQFLAFAAPPMRWWESYRDQMGADDYYSRYGYDRRDDDKEERVIRVSQKNEAKTVANTIANRMRGDGSAKVQGVGPGSVNAAVKSIAIARRTLDESVRLDLACYPEFVRVPAPDPTERQHSALRWSLVSSLPRRPERRPERRGEWTPDRDDRRDAPRDRPVRASKRRTDWKTISYQGDADTEAVHQELKVAATSEAKSVAGAVTTRLRSGETVKITVMGPGSVNQAAKALAVVGATLEEEDGQCAVYAKFIHIPSEDESEKDRSAIQLTCYGIAPIEEPRDPAEYKVAGATNPKSTAGAVANCIREGKSCKLEALGMEAVSQAVKAIAIGRANLASSDDPDIAFIPRFRSLNLSNGKRSVLELLIMKVEK